MSPENTLLEMLQRARQLAEIQRLQLAEAVRLLDEVQARVHVANVDELRELEQNLSRYNDNSADREFRSLVHSLSFYILNEIFEQSATMKTEPRMAGDDTTDAPPPSDRKKKPTEGGK